MLLNSHAAVTLPTELYNTKKAHRGSQPNLFKMSIIITTVSLLTLLALHHPSPYHPQMSLPQTSKLPPRDHPCSNGTCTLCQGLENTKPQPISAGGLFIMAPATNASMATDRHLLAVAIENKKWPPPPKSITSIQPSLSFNLIKVVFKNHRGALIEARTDQFALKGLIGSEFNSGYTRRAATAYGTVSVLLGTGNHFLILDTYAELRKWFYDTAPTFDMPDIIAKTLTNTPDNLIYIPDLPIGSCSIDVQLAATLYTWLQALHIVIHPA